MAKLEKIFLFILSVAGVVFSVSILSIFYPIPFITDVMNEYHRYYPWLGYVFAGYCIFTALCFFVLLVVTLFYPSRSKFMVITKGKGKLQFSKKTVESTARYSFADIEAVGSADIRAKISKRPEKTKVYVKLVLNDTNELVTLTETIQSRIESSLQSSLGIAVKSVSIKVIEHNQSKKDTGASSGNTDVSAEGSVV